MSIELVLIDKNGTILRTSNPYGGGLNLEVVDYKSAHGVFKSVTNANVQTQIVAIPTTGGSLILTDFIISAKKISGGTVVLQFTDGTNTEVIYTGQVTNQPINLSSSFFGRIEGWKDARIELVTDTNNQAATLTLGYVKTNVGREFSDWDAVR